MERHLRQAEKNLKVLHAGVKLGTDKGKGLIPDQALALSTMLNKDHFPQVELSYDDAIRYLRKEAVNLPADTPKGLCSGNLQTGSDRMGKEHWQPCQQPLSAGVAYPKRLFARRTFFCMLKGAIDLFGEDCAYCFS